MFVVVLGGGVGSILDIVPIGKMCTGNRTASVGCGFRRTEMLDVVRARAITKMGQEVYQKWTVSEMERM